MANLAFLQMDLGSESKRPIITRALVLGYPLTGTEFLGRLLAAHPQSVLLQEPHLAITQPDLEAGDWQLIGCI